MRLRTMYCLLMMMTVSASTSATPQSNVAREGKYEVKQLVVPGFEHLPLERKLFVYYLAQAMEAGRDIAWAQLSPNGLRIRKLFERVWPKLATLQDQTARERMEAYYFELLHNHGPHDQNTNEKIVLTGISRERFLDAVTALEGDRQEAEALLSDIFDPEAGRFRVAPEGQDKIAGSASAFYGAGMTEAFLNAMPAHEQRHFLSTPVIENGRPVLRLHNANGRFAEELRRVAFYLGKARDFANLDEKRLIDAHLKTIETGDPADQDRAERLWVQYKPKDISFVIGFTETYDDPLEARGTWEGFILLKNTDPEAARRNQIIRENAARFESRMPVDDEFKKKGAFTPPDSEGAFMVHFAGGHNERSFKGVNLPNGSAIREELGSQSFTAYNKVHDLGNAAEEFPPEILAEYFDPRYHGALKKFGKALPFTLQVEFHEMLGHGSGRDRTGVDLERRSRLGLFGDGREPRRDRRSLHVHRSVVPARARNHPGALRRRGVGRIFGHGDSRVFHPAPRELHESRRPHRDPPGPPAGPTNDPEQRTRRRRLGDSPENAHGVPQVILGEREKMRASFGKYRAKIQKLKSTGDAAGLHAFIREWGVMTPDQQRWAKALIEAKKRLNVASYIVYLNPRFEIVKGTNGHYQDVRLVYESVTSDWRVFMRREQERLAQDALRECEIALGR